MSEKKNHAEIIISRIYDLNQEIDMVNMINTSGSSEQEKKDLYVRYRILCFHRDIFERKLQEFNEKFSRYVL